MQIPVRFSNRIPVIISVNCHFISFRLVDSNFQEPMEIAYYKDNGWSCPPLKTYLIIILFLTQGIPLLAQHTYYVSAAGNDVNSGLSEAEPWQTLGKVNGEMASFQAGDQIDRKSTRLNSSHVKISYAVFCLKKKMRGSLTSLMK